MVKFSSNPAEPPVAIRYYFVPEGTPFLPTPTNFFMYERWSDQREYWNALGEQYNTFKVRANRGGRAAGPRSKPCGQPARFIDQTYPYTRLLYTAAGEALCCGEHNRVFNLKVGLQCLMIGYHRPARILAAEGRTVVGPGALIGRNVLMMARCKAGWVATLQAVRSRSLIAKIAGAVIMAIFQALFRRYLQRLRPFYRMIFERRLGGFLLNVFRTLGFMGRGVEDRGAPSIGFGLNARRGRTIPGQGQARAGFNVTFSAVRRIPADNGFGIGVEALFTKQRRLAASARAKASVAALFSQPVVSELDFTTAIQATFNGGKKISMLDPSKGLMNAAFTALSLITPPGAGGSLPNPFVLRTGTGASCSCASNKTITMTYNSTKHWWRGTVSACGGTLMATVAWQSGPTAGWYVTLEFGLAGIASLLSGTDGANPNLTGNPSISGPTCSGNMPVTVTRT